MDTEEIVSSDQQRPKTHFSLRYGSISCEFPDGDTSSTQPTGISQRRSYIAVAVLCYINLLNYMDRYTIAGVLLSIQKYFQISDSTSGLLQTGIGLILLSIATDVTAKRKRTLQIALPSILRELIDVSVILLACTTDKPSAKNKQTCKICCKRCSSSLSESTSRLFICSFMLLAPVFGYLGDRYDRKYIMIAGLIVWLVTTLGSSFAGREHFWVLVLTRALVGTGEASYSTIAPTIIGDLFTGTKRTLMISFFYIFIPVGSGLGYIMGATIASATGDWRWALRVNPALGALGLFLLVFLIPNPPRGAADGYTESPTENTSYIEDIKYLLKNRSFVWSSFGVTAMAFVTGALAFWTPTFLSRAQVTQGLREPCKVEPCDTSDSFIFGAITVVTGIVGVFLGTFISKMLRDRVSNADPLICAVGMLSSSPCFFIAVILASKSIPVTYTFIAIGETLLSLNWAILADILLYVVVPTRRATAEALQILVCHLLGDAGSPYLIGLMSDALRKYNPDSPSWDFRRLEYSVYVCPFVGILGGLFFLMTSLYIKEDRKAAEMLVLGQSTGQQTTSRVTVT